MLISYICIMKTYTIYTHTVEVHDNDTTTKHWYLNNQLHREDGPAIEYAYGGKDWYLGGVEYTEKQFNDKLSRNPS